MDERVDNPQTEIRHAPLSRGPAPPVVRRSRSRAWLGLILVLVVALGGAYWFLYRAPQTTDRPSAGRATETAPQPVGAETIANGDIRIILNELGTVTPLANVTVQDADQRPAHRRGASRKARLSRPATSWHRSTIARTRSRSNRRKGTLAHDQALLGQAQTDLKRYQTLARQDSIAKQQADDQVFLVAQYQGSVQSDQAQIDSAKLNVAYCHIVSPVTGRVGLRQVDAGNYVQTSGYQWHRGDHPGTADLRRFSR